MKKKHRYLRTYIQFRFNFYPFWYSIWFYITSYDLFSRAMAWGRTKIAGYWEELFWRSRWQKLSKVSKYGLHIFFVRFLCIIREQINFCEFGNMLSKFSTNFSAFSLTSGWEGWRRNSRAWKPAGVSKVCCLVRLWCGALTEPCLNHGSEIFRFDLAGFAPLEDAILHSALTWGST